MTKRKEYKLGDVLAVRYGKDHKSLGNGQYPVYGSGGIMRYADRYLYDKESILIPRKGSLNNIFYQEGPFWTVDTMFWTEIDKAKVEPKFLFYQLTLVDLKNLNVGSAVPSLTVPVINDIDITLPPLDEQKRIAGVLSSLDDKIDLLNRENATLEALAETLFRHYFIENPDPTWKEGNIADVVDFNPARKLGKGEKAPYVEMANIGTIGYAPSSWRIRSFVSGTKFINGDTLMARISPCLENGKAAFVDFLEKEQVGWGSTEFIVMRSKLGIHLFFAYVLSRYDDFRDHAVSSLVGSSGRQRVDLDNLIKYPFIIPDKQAIELFNHELNTIFPKMQNNQKQILTLTAQRDTLLSRLMNGEVNVVE